jgi:DNA segregation ATPase FtsK/SpoIIIE, S-DNA-T family
MLDLFTHAELVRNAGAHPLRAAGASAASTQDTRKLPDRKSREVLGVLLALAAALLVLALVSHRPDDASLFHVASDAAPSRNWIGPFGANLSALCFGFLGLSSLLLPVLCAVSALRRLRPRRQDKVVGRGFGTLVMLAALPALLQLVLGEVSWRGATLRSGGVAGFFVARFLESRLGLVGALFLILGGVIVGSTLIVQSSLGELLEVWRKRGREFWQSFTLRRARKTEHKEKARTRRRLVEKHLNARVEPVRVAEKEGPGHFGIRRVEPQAVPMLRRKAPKTVKPKSPQKAMAFAEEPIEPSATLPPVNLLNLQEESSSLDEADLIRLGEQITQRCAEFGVEGTIEGISPGPVITVFELQPAPGVKVSQIVNLQNDLALALRAESVRIDRVPGRSTLGIEVPNADRRTIALGPLLADDKFVRSPSVLTLALGRDLHGNPYYADLATMPHLLVAGATGSGKSVGLQSMLTSILYKATRDQVQFILIDPKRIELGVYSEIPHLKTEVVMDPKKAANALRWAVSEMERRYKLLAELHVRSIAYYNHAISDPEVQRRLSLRDEEGEVRTEDLQPLPYYVIVIDELADLMMVAANEVETSIARLAQMARAVGIHLIVATQRPSVDILTGTIKANFPCRIAYATASRPDSRTILDNIGAEQLLGKGDMLLMPPSAARMVRLHGAYISEQETAGLVRWLKRQGKPQLDPEVLKAPVEDRSAGGGNDGSDDLFEEAARLVVSEGQASASFLQRRMRIGFSRAGRLIDMMEQDGILGPPQGSKPREVLVKPDYFEELASWRRGSGEG